MPRPRSLEVGRLFSFFRRKLRFIKQLMQEPAQTEAGPLKSKDALTLSLDQNLDELKMLVNQSPDVIIRRFAIKVPRMEQAAIVFVDGLTDKNVINESILRPLMLESGKEGQLFSTPQDYAEELLLTVGELKRTHSMNDLVAGVLSGDTAVLFHQEQVALLISTEGWEKRAISEPDTEVIVKGPRDGFTESLRTNTALLRRRIGDASLTFEALIVGKKTKTDIVIGYVKGIVNEKLVEEVKRRLRRINTDGILGAGFIEQFIEDAPFSPFATVGYTERPDVCAAKLLEGRIAIFVDGTPVVNTVPLLFIENFQNPDDYNFRPFYSTFVRLGRYLAFLISILSPAIYVALSSYHQELLPTPFLITLAAATEGTPFPAIIEAIGMGIVFEILREAGIRLPRPIGQAVSIIGALVIGEATVTAGLVGAPVVIITALTAIASFVVPKQVEVGAVLRLFLTLLAGILGACGIVAGLLAIFIHLAALRSFGVPYLTPITPLTPNDLKDVAVRAPIWMMLTRPRLIGWQDPVRQSFRLMPHPPEDEEE